MYDLLKPHIKPLQKPHPPIGVAGSQQELRHAEDGRRARLHADEPQPEPGLLSQPLGRRGERRGQDRAHAEPRDWRMVREVFVAETDEEAWKLSVGGMMGRMMREYFLPLLGHFGFKEYLKHDQTCPTPTSPSNTARSTTG